MAFTNFNPWQVESLAAFNYLCCPECVFRSKEEYTFQAHALQNHPQSTILFNKSFDDISVNDKGFDSIEGITVKREPEVLLEFNQKEFTLKNEELISDDDIAADDNDLKEEPMDEDYKPEIDIDADYDDTEYYDADTVQETRKSNGRSRRNFHCSACDKVFPKRLDLNRHMKKDHTDMPCEQCDQVFDDLLKLKDHQREEHRETTFKCDLCTESFETKGQLRQHKGSAHGLNMNKRNSFRCSACNVVYPKRMELQNHMKTAHVNMPCNQCGLVFEDLTKLKSHMNQEHTEKNFKCEECDKSFKAQFILNRHKDSVHANKSEKNFKCDTCPFETHVVRYLKQHTPFCPGTEVGKRNLEERRQSLTIPKSEKNIRCDKCPFVTYAERYLKKHQTLCPGTEDGLRALEERRRKQREAWHSKKGGDDMLLKSEGGLPLDLPPRKPKTPKVKKPKEEKRSYQCIECKDTYESSGAYINHFRKSHGGMIPPDLGDLMRFFCDQCPESFSQKALLENHLEKAHPDSSILNHECTECNLKFSFKKYIEHFRSFHKRIPPEYADKEVFYCEKCPNFYFSMGGLKIHLRVHAEKKSDWTRVENEKDGKFYYKKKTPFECNECSKTFKSRQHFSEHKKKVHLKYTPYHCEQCPRKFALRKSLNGHIQLVHSRVNCDICSKEICNSFMLKRHKADSHGIFPPNSYKCDECPMFFTKEANLITHIQSKHQLKTH